MTPLELNASDRDFNSGLITEQFVGQELRVYEISKQMIPVEVKASHRGRLKSLRYFMDKID